MSTAFLRGKRFVSRQTNVFAALFDFVDGEKLESVIDNALLSDSLPEITTPYFKLFELMALCKAGKSDIAQSYISSYWSGMIRQGATSVWEAYDPTVSGAEHYAMYGSKYGKSLCHAWGSGPILLWCRYTAGVNTDVFGSFTVSPSPGGYTSFSAKVPVSGGEVCVDYERPVVKVRSTVPGGTFVNGGLRQALEPGREYEFTINC